MANASAVGIPALSWPLEVVDGRLGLFPDNAARWAGLVRAVITTRTGERAMRETYGCGAVSSMFESAGLDDTEDQVRRALGTWVPAVSVVSVRVRHREDERSVEVGYQLPGGTVRTVEANFRSPEVAGG